MCNSLTLPAHSNKEGKTAYDVAVENERTEILKLLETKAPSSFRKAHAAKEPAPSPQVCTALVHIYRFLDIFKLCLFI